MSEILSDKQDSDRCPSRRGSVVTCVRVYEHVCAQTQFFLLEKLCLETCGLEGLPLRRGKDAAPPKTLIIPCQTKHGNRVTEEHQCLWDQGPIYTKGCIQADPTDNTIAVLTEASLCGDRGIGAKTLHHPLLPQGRPTMEVFLFCFVLFLFLFSQPKEVICSRGGKKHFVLSWIFVKDGL